MASAAKPIHRKSAERILRSFIERVKQLNSIGDYAYKVSKVVLFGSYLQANERINDIDVALLLEPNEQDRDKQRLLEKKRVDASDRNFSSFFSQLFWPRDEVRLFLKSRSRALSLHDYEVDAPLLADTETLTLFENGKWIDGF
jgi:predicted nucleotidyltransferase